MEQAIQIVIGGLLQGSGFAIVALGYSLVYRVTGIINLSQGAFCILGALLTCSLEESFGCPASQLSASWGFMHEFMLLGLMSEELVHAHPPACVCLNQNRRAITLIAKSGWRIPGRCS